MIGKIIKFTRKILIRILGLSDVKSRLQSLEAELNKVWLKHNKLSEENKTLIERIERLERMVNVGLDVRLNRYDRSWAVVCIPGNGTDIVMFADLGKEDARHIRDFMKNFEARQSRVDLSLLVPISEFLGEDWRYKDKRGRRY